jgi:hypothetical protein
LFLNHVVFRRILHACQSCVTCMRVVRCPNDYYCRTNFVLLYVGQNNQQTSSTLLLTSKGLISKPQIKTAKIGQKSAFIRFFSIQHEAAPSLHQRSVIQSARSTEKGHIFIIITLYDTSTLVIAKTATNIALYL